MSFHVSDLANVMLGSSQVLRPSRDTTVCGECEDGVLVVVPSSCGDVGTVPRVSSSRLVVC